MLYNKLIRDRIPEIMEACGKKFEVRTLGAEEYLSACNQKLSEELQEYLTADDEDAVAELADLVEVVYALLERKGISIADFERIRLAKRAERGGFQQSIFLVSVDD